jgi:hypothetical protein
MRRLALLITIAVCAGLGPHGEASAAIVDCAVFAYYPNVEITSARNMGCREAARDMRRHRTGIATRFRTPGGFACARVSGFELAGQWRCVAGARAYRFDFMD